MSDFADTGVTGSAPESGVSSDNSPAASPAVGAQSNESGAVTGQSPAAPSALDGQPEQPASDEAAATAPQLEAEEPVYDQIDPSQLADEKARNAFIAMRQGLKDTESFKTQYEPVAAWVDERGGLDPIKSDVEMVDNLYSADPNLRGQAYAQLYQTSPEAHARMIEDFAAAPQVQAKILEQMGVQPHEFEQFAQWVQSEAWKNPPEPIVESQFNPDTLNDIQHPVLKDLYKTLPQWKRNIADGLLGNDLTEYMTEQYGVTQQERATAQKAQADAQAAKQAKEQQIEQTQTQTYQSVRSMVETELQKIFPNDPEALQYALAQAETKLYNSPEGAALWQEIAGHIKDGEIREMQKKLPQMIAKANAVGKESGKWLSGVQSKARQLDEIMRASESGSPTEVMQMLQRLRGGQVVTRPGTQVAANGNGAIPKNAGQYEKENVLSYWPGNR